MAKQILTQNATLFNAPAQNAATVRQSFPQNTTDILTALTDLDLHGDFDAAALALGDAWLTLTSVDQLQVIALIRKLGASNA